MRTYSQDELKSKLTSLGYRWPLGVHIVGVRAKNPIPNQFNDTLYCISDTTVISGAATTIPGNYYLLNLLNPKGAAVLKEGQWNGCWAIGMHHTYEALVQVKPITVFRDNNKNAVAEEIKGTEDTGLFGINIHHAGINFLAKFVDNFSAGCQVWQDISKFNQMLAECKKSKQSSFTYTLINEF